MSDKPLFEGLTDEQQAEYQQEAEQRWDPELVRSSNRRWKHYGKEKQQAILQEADTLYRAWADAMPAGVDSEQVQAIVAQWHQNLRYFYEPTPAMLKGLGEMYVQDPRFADKFRQLAPDLPEFMQRSIISYCEQLR